VTCLGCGVALKRKTHWRKPKCGQCVETLRRRNQRAELATVRAQARALRIVLAECGYSWERFDAFREDMRLSNLHEIDHARPRSYQYDQRLMRRSVRMDRTEAQRAAQQQRQA
jgi:hypothetical protein